MQNPEEEVVERPSEEETTNRKLKPHDMIILERDIAGIEHLNARVKEFKSEIENITLKIRLAKQEVELLEFKKKQATTSFKQNADMLTLRKEKHQKFVKMLGKKYGITQANWGFDPETGEIK